MRPDASPTDRLVQADSRSDTLLLELLTVTDVATLLKVSKSWVYEHTRARGKSASHRLPYIKVGKYIRFDPQLVRAFLDRQTGR